MDIENVLQGADWSLLEKWNLNKNKIEKKN